MGDWYPILVPYVAGQGWQTWRYWPVGDPVISRIADFDVRIRTAPEVVVAAPGFVGATGNERRYQLNQARAFAFLASPDYVRYVGSAVGIPVQVYVTSRYQQVGPVLVQVVEQSLALFSELYGPYPYEEFVLAENGFLTAMEYSAIVSLSGFAFDAYDGTAESLLVAITAHEVAHQWWYGSVGNDQINEPWLDESLAMMSELLFYERYYPALVDWWWWYRVERWNPTGAVDVTIYDYSTSEGFVHNMYGQAAYFLFDLRERMGDEAFRAFLRTYYQQNGLQFATRDDFFAAVQASTAVDISDLRAQYFDN
jgi:aminopeptidase N